MAKLLGLNIPPGLEELYQNVIRALTAYSDTAVTTQAPQIPRALKQNLITRSLFVLWAPLFDSFTDARKLSWQTYWGGWPGSGFSSFVQVNAPRYAKGLSLLLDPPSEIVQLIVDGNFANGTSKRWADGILARAWSFYGKKATHTISAPATDLQYDNLSIWDSPQFYDSGGGGGIWGYIGGEVRIANKFVPPSTMHCKVLIMDVGTFNSTPGGVYINIKHGGSSPSGATTIATSAVIPWSLLYYYSAYYYFIFPTAVTLTAGETYWLEVVQTDEPTTYGDNPFKNYLQYFGGEPDQAAQYWYTNALSPQSWAQASPLAIYMRMFSANFDLTPLQQYFLIASHNNYWFTFTTRGTRGKLQIKINGQVVATIPSNYGNFKYPIPDGTGDFRLLGYISDYYPNVLTITPSFDCDANISNVSIAATSDTQIVPDIGVELLVNGDFSDGLNNWEPYNFALSGAGVAATDGGYDNFISNFLTVAPNWQAANYRLSLHIGAGTGDVEIYIYNGDTETTYAYQLFSGGDGDVYIDFSADFIADEIQPYLFLAADTENAGVVLSNFSLKRTS